MVQEITEFSKKLSPEIYLDLKRSLELGKWPDGRALTSEQREICMQAVISYEVAHLPEEERTGYMEQACRSKPAVNDAEKISVTRLDEDS